MFLFCKWFSKTKINKKFRDDIENIVDEILNKSGEE